MALTTDPAREAARAAFLTGAGRDPAALSPLAGDASNRRYLRLADGQGRAVLMDAPPATGEDTGPFLAATAELRGRGLSAPEVLAADPALGFVLLEDLGDTLYARHCTAAPGEEHALYAAAVDLLAERLADAPARLGPGPNAPALAPYGPATYAREARLATDWYLPAAAGRDPAPDLVAEFEARLAEALAPAAADRSALVLRDYHAENLIWLPERDGLARVGLLDYQDALAGHPAYDLVSLLEDARRDTAEDLREAMVARFLDRRPDLDAGAFRAAYAALGAQRNLKIVGIFARLCRRDGKPRYLDLIPRVWDHLMRDLAHPVLGGLAGFVARHLPPPEPGTLARIAAGAPRPSAAPPRPRPSAGAGPEAAMVLAAGFGTRMRPLTDRMPKALVPVAGRALVDRALDRVAEAGIPRAVVNLHYLGDMLRAHLARRAEPTIAFSEELPQILETGGGIAQALPLLGARPFAALNSDAVWTGPNPLAALAAAWDGAAMDALLLLVPREAARGYTRPGDFFLDRDGAVPRRRGAAESAPLVYTGAQILAPRAFEGAPGGAFSLNLVWDRLLAEGRLAAVVHPGGWADVGTPEGIAEAEALLAGAGEAPAPAPAGRVGA